MIIFYPYPIYSIVFDIQMLQSSKITSLTPIIEIFYLYFCNNIIQMFAENYNKFNDTLGEQHIQSQTQSKQSFAFLLVNSSSGSRVGDELIKSQIREIIVGTQLNKTSFIIYDMYQQKERIQAFQDAKDKASNNQNAIIYIVICGGDGTVEWVIEEALKANLNFEDVIFTVLPIGTGNDFAKSIGWGDFQFTVGHDKFEKLAVELDKAKVGYFDIWESSIECFDSGSIIQIKNGQEVERQSNKLVKNFTNYFGIGTDAQIAYIAQKLRAKTIALKKVAYGFAGFLSFWMFCGGLTRKISQILQLKTQKPLPQPPSQTKKPSQTQQLTQNSISIQPQQLQSERMQSIKISKFDCCMTFLNSTSSMDLQGIWQTPYKTNSENKKDVNYKEQCVNDGMIQIVSYRNQISLWFQRVLHMAKKVGQGNGPFIIHFRQPAPGSSHTIYVHINGEPYRITNTKCITVSQSSQFPSGKIKVLYRSPEIKQKQ